MNQGKSALNTSATHVLRIHKPPNPPSHSLQALHTPAITWRPSPHSSTKPTFLPHSLLYCTTTQPAHLLFPSSHCYTLWAHHLSVPVVRFARLLCHPIAVPLVRPRPTRASSLLYRAPVHAVRYCHTSCSTAHRLTQIDWLTCGISSASTTAVIGIGQPFLFGPSMHRSDWWTCTS
jgi:hypothetical protein